MTQTTPLGATLASAPAAIAEIPPIFYPSSDGEPVAETYDHFSAIVVTLEVLQQYLAGQRATVLANQFLYYAQGFPRLRVAPDVMVIFDVEPGGRDNYKTWEEGQVPKVIFEITSGGTRKQDETFKFTLYEQMGVEEYWLFDPKGEWLDPVLQGYRLRGEHYEAIADSCSTALDLRLEAAGNLINFYRRDTGEKLLAPQELAAALQAAEQRAEQEAQRAEQEAQRAAAAAAELAQLREQLRAFGVEPQPPSP